MARPVVKPIELPKQKRGQPTNSTNKQAKKNWAAFEFYRVFGQIRVTSTLDIFSRITRDYMWLPADLHQNFLQSFDFPGFLSISHKASVFFLELLLGQEVF